MSSDELGDYELKQMTYNAYKVCEEVASRIDGALGPSGFLKGFKACKIDELFFSDKEYTLQSFYLQVKKKERDFLGQHTIENSQSSWIYILKLA